MVIDTAVLEKARINEQTEHVISDDNGDDEDNTLKVMKRDGRIVDFDSENIVDAIVKAFKETHADAMDAQDMESIQNISSSVESRIRELYAGRPVNISEIQNLVEHALLDNHYYDVANAYKDYRWKKDVAKARQTDANEAVKRFVRRDKDIVNENANKDGRVFSTQRDLLAGAISKSAALQMLPKDVSNAHAKCDIHFHDADYSPFTTMTNCSLPNFKSMLANGFALGNATMGSPNSIETAATQVTQIMLDVASSQYGGQTLNRADETLAPYAQKNYAKNLETARAMFPDDEDIDRAKDILRHMKEREQSWLHIKDREPLDMDTPFHDDASEIDKIREIYAKILTRKNIYDAMQTLEYQVNTQHATCGQTPFVTVGFGLGTSWFEREITRCIFYIRIGGLGSDHRTAIFPKLTYTIKHGINSESTDPNYDLKQLALECTSKRMYPDILFYENIVNITGSFKAPMGAVDGDEVVTWSDNGSIHTEGFASMWNRLASRYAPRHQGTDGDDWFIDLSDTNISIKDSHTGAVRFVRVRRIINNQSRVWKRVVFNGGRVIDCTPDHPFEVDGRGRVEVKDLHGGDIVHRSISAEDQRAYGPHMTAISVKSVDDIDIKQRSYDVTTESDYFDVSGIVSHNCRSFLQGWINPETGEDEEEGRMNLGVVTVNIPRIGIESRGSVKRFWKIFEQRMDVAHHALQFRIKRCKQTTPANAPVLWQNGAFGKLGDNGSVDSLMKNSRATVSLGYIGLYEATAMLFGRQWINNFGWDEDARDFAVSILRAMTDHCKQWEREEGYHYSVYGTPSESLTDRFSRADREKFGVIPGITDHDFYTNSFHRPVWLTGNNDHMPTEGEQEVMGREHFHVADNGGPFSKLDFEEPFLKYTAGGHIVYTEEPRLTQNLKALEAIWDYGHSVGIDYLGTNTPIDHCFKCGYEGDFDPTDTGYKCPQCGNDDPDTCDVVKRVCGYLGNPQSRPMIHGRHEELIHRKKQMDGETGRITLGNGTEEAFYDDRSLNIK